MSLLINLATHSSENYNNVSKFLVMLINVPYPAFQQLVVRATYTKACRVQIKRKKSTLQELNLFMLLKI